MKDYIEERAVESHIILLKIKQLSGRLRRNFGMSKSTIHKDVTERLLQNQSGTGGGGNGRMLDQNKSERHIRGGLATKEK